MKGNEEMKSKPQPRQKTRKQVKRANEEYWKKKAK